MRDEGVIYVARHPLMPPQWPTYYCVGWGVKLYSLCIVVQRCSCGNSSIHFALSINASSDGRMKRRYI